MQSVEDVYTCACGNVTWIVLERRVRCASCKNEYNVQNTPVRDFNETVTADVEELEQAL